MSEVDKRATPTSTAEFLSAAKNVYETTEGALPTAEQLGMLFAQWALETATGKAMFNFNVGNIKATDLAAQSYFSQFTGTQGVVRPDGVPGEGVNHFRAYDSLAEGLKSWISLLKNTRYAAGWSGLKGNDVKAFAEGIAHGGYVPPPSQPAYIRGILARYNDFMRNVDPTKLVAVASNGYVSAIGAVLVIGGIYALARTVQSKGRRT